MQSQINTLFLLIVLLFSKVAVARHNSVIFNRPADSPQASYALALLSLAYKELNYEIHLIDFSRKNALLAANNGVLDGQLGRDISIEAENKNLIRVNYVLFDYKLMLFKNCQPNTLNMLQNVAILSGYPVQQHYLESTHFKGKVIEVKNISTQLNLLAQKKVEGAIMLDFVLPKANLELPETCMQKQLLNTFSLYHYIHKKHAELAPKLLAALKKLNNNGTTQALRAKYNLH